MFASCSRFALVVAVAGFMISGLPARADTLNYTATMTAASEVPVTASKGAGTLTATYDTATKTLSWKGAYTDLTGAESAAHFHGPAAAGASAGVALPIDAAKSPFEGSAPLTDAQAADLAAGMWYVNIHTAANPKGEIRGQVVKGGM